MQLTERYILLCRDLAEAGYLWQPRAGDWILDITDESIGMLTTMVEKPELVRKVNVQIPYGLQIEELLAVRGCRRATVGDVIGWSDRAGNELYCCPLGAWQANADEEALAALVADFRRHGPGTGGNANMRPDIRYVSAVDTRPLRKEILRPDLSDAELLYPGDDDPETVHFAAFVGGNMVGIASLYHVPPRGDADPGAWRLRAMGTRTSARGGGIGGAILEAAVEHARRQGATNLWCDARVAALGFYRHYGFVVEGEEYTIPGVGPHFLMRRRFDRNH